MGITKIHKNIIIVNSMQIPYTASSFVDRHGVFDWHLQCKTNILPYYFNEIW